MTTIEHRAVRRLESTEIAWPPEAPNGTPGAILRAALRLFAERGFSGTSVRELASAAGLQATTLYLHYPSKTHVLAELCRIGHKAHLYGTNTALKQCGTSAREQLAAFVRAHVLFHARYSMLAVVCNAELHMLPPELGAETFKLRHDDSGVLLGIIQAGSASGEFEAPDAWLAAAMIGGAGLRVANWYTPESDLSPEVVAERMADYSLKMLKAR